MSREDLINTLDTMTVITGLCRTEVEALDEASIYISENNNAEFAKRILNMIENNGASNEDIKQFCETYIKSKEEEK